LINEVAVKAEIRKIGVIPFLVKRLECPDPDVKKSSAMAICIAMDDCRFI
jgi:hypothetical protein